MLALGVVIVIGCSFNGGQRAGLLPAMAASDTAVAELIRRMPDAITPDAIADDAGAADAAPPNRATARDNVPAISRLPQASTSPSPGAIAMAPAAQPVSTMPPSRAASTVHGHANAQPASSLAAMWDGWPWLLAAALLLLLPVLWRQRRKANQERRAVAARPRTITWSQVKAPEAQLDQDNVEVVYDHLPLPSVAVAIHLPAPPLRSPSPSPADTMLRHDSSRSADARLRAIDSIVEAPLVLTGALPPCVSMMRYEPGEPRQPDINAVVSPVESEAMNERVQPVAAAPSTNGSEHVAKAKHWLTVDRPEQALEALAPLLDGGAANGETWTVAGWSWWRIARDRPGRQLDAATQAATAFGNALRVEPDRASLLSRMIARCHLMQASQQAGDDRLASLDQAIAVFDRHLQGNTRDDAALLEWAQALHERAVASPREERLRWLDRSERVIEQHWGTTVTDAAEPVQRLWVNLLLARADLVDMRAAAALHARATAMLRAGIPHWDESQREAWLTRLIEAERAHALRLSGAARISRLQATQASVEGWLTQARTIDPLLAWIGLLGDWAASLHGSAAQAKLNQAGAMFERIEAISPDDGAQACFARAYYLRLRAHSEFGLARWNTLEQARTLLAAIASDDVPRALVDLETAEIHLEQARLSDGAAQQSHFASAARLAEAAAQAPDNEVRALLCALTALVALARSAADESPARMPSAPPRMKALARRLHELAPHDPNALRVIASVHLASDEPQAACELCAAAWDAGAVRAELMPIWREADARWAKALDPANQDMHWARLHQGMRMASSSP